MAEGGGPAGSRGRESGVPVFLLARPTAHSSSRGSPDPTQRPPGRRHFPAPSLSFVSILRKQEPQMPVLTCAPSLVTRATQGFTKGQAREPPLPLVARGRTIPRTKLSSGAPQTLDWERPAVRFLFRSVFHHLFDLKNKNCSSRLL